MIFVRYTPQEYLFFKDCLTINFFIFAGIKAEQYA